MHAFQIIVKESGMRGLWRGWLPNVQRAALVNLGGMKLTLNATSVNEHLIQTVNPLKL